MDTVPHKFGGEIHFMSRARGVPTLMNYYEQADDQHTP